MTRLAKYSGLSDNPLELYDLADVVNLVKYYPGRSPNGKHDEFPHRAGVAEATKMKYIVDTYDRVVLLGSAVRGCFIDAHILPMGHEWFEPYERYTGYGARTHMVVVAASPHPAGTSMFWNDTAARAAGEAFWHRVVAEAAYALGKTYLDVGKRKSNGTGTGYGVRAAE